MAVLASIIQEEAETKPQSYNIQKKQRKHHRSNSSFSMQEKDSDSDSSSSSTTTHHRHHHHHHHSHHHHHRSRGWEPLKYPTSVILDKQHDIEEGGDDTTQSFVYFPLHKDVLLATIRELLILDGTIEARTLRVSSTNKLSFATTSTASTATGATAGTATAASTKSTTSTPITIQKIDAYLRHTDPELWPLSSIIEGDDSSSTNAVGVVASSERKRKRRKMSNTGPTTTPTSTPTSNKKQRKVKKGRGNRISLSHLQSPSTALSSMSAARGNARTDPKQPNGTNHKNIDNNCKQDDDTVPNGEKDESSVKKQQQQQQQQQHHNLPTAEAVAMKILHRLHPRYYSKTTASGPGGGGATTNTSTEKLIMRPPRKVSEADQSSSMIVKQSGAIHQHKHYHHSADSVVPASSYALPRITSPLHMKTIPMEDGSQEIHEIMDLNNRNESTGAFCIRPDLAVAASNNRNYNQLLLVGDMMHVSISNEGILRDTAMRMTRQLLTTFSDRTLELFMGYKAAHATRHRLTELLAGLLFDASHAAFAWEKTEQELLAQGQNSFQSSANIDTMIQKTLFDARALKKIGGLEPSSLLTHAISIARLRRRRRHHHQQRGRRQVRGDGSSSMNHHTTLSSPSSLSSSSSSSLSSSVMSSWEFFATTAKGKRMLQHHTREKLLLSAGKQRRGQRLRKKHWLTSSSMMSQDEHQQQHDSDTMTTSTTTTTTTTPSATNTTSIRSRSSSIESENVASVDGEHHHASPSTSSALIVLPVNLDRRTQILKDMPGSKAVSLVKASQSSSWGVGLIKEGSACVVGKARDPPAGKKPNQYLRCGDLIQYVINERGEEAFSPLCVWSNTETDGTDWYRTIVNLFKSSDELYLVVQRV